MLSFARVRALAIVAILAIGAVISAYLAISRDSGADAVAGGECANGEVKVDLALPDDAQEVEINVYNATEQGGLASQVAENFSNRGFQVGEYDDDPLDAEVAEVAMLRYGPDAVGSAHVVQAYFLGAAAEQFDVEREGAVVDIVVGNQFRQLATETEVKQSIAGMGPPTPPEGTCAQGGEG